eukprot:6179089-Pleurochrysis_carterae.AAC.5
MATKGWKDPCAGSIEWPMLQSGITARMQLAGFCLRVADAIDPPPSPPPRYVSKGVARRLPSRHFA